MAHDDVYRMSRKKLMGGGRARRYVPQKEKLALRLRLVYEFFRKLPVSL